MDYLQRAKAFIFAAEEDFGILPLEAQACGTPVIAYGKGGALETVRGLEHEKPTGLFFPSKRRMLFAKRSTNLQTAPLLFLLMIAQKTRRDLAYSDFVMSLSSLLKRNCYLESSVSLSPAQPTGCLIFICMLSFRAVNLIKTIQIYVNRS